jgi:hypothetical protein
VLTAKHLITRTPGKIVYRSSYPRIRIIKDFKKKNDEYRGVFAHVALGNTESTGDTYALTLRCHGTKKDPDTFDFTPDSLVWVHCSCPYFTYHLEVVLKLRGSSDIRNSNAELPKIKNPSLKPYLCKHLYALTLYMIAKDKKKVKPAANKNTVKQPTKTVKKPPVKTMMTKKK